MRIITGSASILISIILGGVFLFLAGYDPIETYSYMLSGALGSTDALVSVLVKSSPFILCGLAVAISFRAGFWNIGAEGQMTVGVIFGTAAALFLPPMPQFPRLLLIFAAAAMGGGLWALLPVIAKSYFKTSEIITTLMMNYIAIFVLKYLVYGPWKDPNGYGFPLTQEFSMNSKLPSIAINERTFLHYGFFIAIAACILTWFILRYHRSGYMLDCAGKSRNACRYAGISHRKVILAAVVISGAIAAIGGMSEISGIQYRLKPGFSPGYGYTAILIACLVWHQPLLVVFSGLFLGFLLVGCEQAQIDASLPISVSEVFQALILLSYVSVEAASSHLKRIIRKRRKT